MIYPALGSAGPLCGEAWATVAEYLPAAAVYDLRLVHRDLAAAAARADHVWDILLQRDFPAHHAAAADDDGAVAREPAAGAGKHFIHRYTAAELHSVPHLRTAIAFAALHRRPVAQLRALVANRVAGVAGGGALMDMPWDLMNELVWRRSPDHRPPLSPSSARAVRALPEPHSRTAVRWLQPTTMVAALFYRTQPRVFTANVSLMGCGIAAVPALLCYAWCCCAPGAALFAWWNHAVAVVTGSLPLFHRLFYSQADATGEELVRWAFGSSLWRWGDAADITAGAAGHPAALAAVAALALLQSRSHAPLLREAEGSVVILWLQLAAELMLSAAFGASRLGPFQFFYTAVTRVIVPAAAGFISLSRPWWALVAAACTFPAMLLAEQAAAAVIAGLVWPMVDDTAAFDASALAAELMRVWFRAGLAVVAANDLNGQPSRLFSERPGRAASFAVAYEVLAGVVEAAVFLQTRSVAAALAWRLVAGTTRYVVKYASAVCW
jgi:hypothetical protein